MVLNELVYQKDYNFEVMQDLVRKGISPFLAKLFAARNIDNFIETQDDLKLLLHFKYFKNIDLVAKRLAKAVIKKENIVVIADYDADGATSCAVIIKSLELFGLHSRFLVPNRVQGYGLSNALVDSSLSLGVNLLLTVDNGISSVESINYANNLGLEVIVTDHHLPSNKLPNCLIINPNQNDCNFKSKSIAGVGVAFYVMLALRNELRKLNYFNDNNISNPNLASLLDLVALGTICDVVKLDHNNRILVANGLKKIRNGNMCFGIMALFEVAKKDFRKATVKDLGFLIGPRINASGRLKDISMSIKCLLSKSLSEALIYAKDLNKLNDTRRKIEISIIEDVMILAQNIMQNDLLTLCMYNEKWHQGVIGIVAGRLKDKFNKPVIVFTKDKDNILKGSGRSIMNLHLKDTLDLINKQYPNLILKFGGHSMAVGLNIELRNLDKFKIAFEDMVKKILNIDDLKKTYITDGSLDHKDINLANAIKISNLVWGQGFNYPIFYDKFLVVNQRNIGINHSKLMLKKQDSLFEAMLFKQKILLPEKIFAVYKIVFNEWGKHKELQLYIEYWHPV